MGSCACGGSCPRCKEDPKVQTKLRVSERGDALEREADGIADSVMRMPASPVPEGEGMDRGSSGAAPSTPSELSSSLDDGAPLDGATRGFFEPRFQTDLSNVRVHTGSSAATLADSYNARAFTYGNHIVFNQSEYTPHTHSGKQLMAHELAHVQQQAPVVAREDDGAGKVIVRTGWEGLKCPKEKCAGKEDGIRADMRRALSYTAQALSALDGKLSGRTERLLDWYFSDHSKATVDTVRKRLGCLNGALQEAADHDNYGCGERWWAHAHTGGSTEICDDSGSPICLDPSYFTELSQRQRAETFIHECGHRIGLSSGPTRPDTYSSELKFLQLTTAEALDNTDSFAWFVGAVALGARTTVTLPQLTLAGGRTSNDGFYGKLHVGFEASHPNLRIVTLGTGIEIGGIDSAGIGSLFLAARFGDPRPGQKGKVFLNLQGQLSYMVSGNKIGPSVGGEATLGVRLGEFEIGAQGGVLKDPTPEEGARTTFYGGLSFTFIPEFGKKDWF
jgi:hypothetical protein